MQKDVIGLEHRIGFELPAPVAVGMLTRDYVIARPDDRRLDLRQVRIDAAEARAAKPQAKPGIVKRWRRGFSLRLF
jgi:hypothetical protein